MPNYSIPLAAKTISALINSDTDTACELIAGDMEAEKSTLGSLLDHYCQEDRGTVDESSISVERDNLHFDQNFDGSVVINFQEDAYLGCRDKDVHEDRSPQIGFKIDLKNKNIVFEVPESSRLSDVHGFQ